MATNYLGSGRVVKRTIVGDAGPADGPGGVESDASLPGGDVDSDERETNGSGGDGGPIDPASLGGNASGSDAPFGYTPTGRRRNRPVGSTTRTGNKSTRSASRTTLSLESILFSAHLMASIFFKEEILACQEQEAKALAEAITAVTELYDVPLASEKTIAWTNLVMVLGTVEGTRIAALLAKHGKRGPKKGPVAVPGKTPQQPDRIQVGLQDMPSGAGVM